MRDGPVITGGGVTAGIDFALVVLAEIGGPALAQTVQLGLEYAPAPPFDAGSPETAPPDALQACRARFGMLSDQREAEAREAASRLADLGALR